jgi:hypothetical protein
MLHSKFPCDGRTTRRVISTTGLQHLPVLRLRVVLDRDSSRRSHRSGVGQTRATLTPERNAA